MTHNVTFENLPESLKAQFRTEPPNKAVTKSYLKRRIADHMKAAASLFVAIPSATNFAKLETAMLAYQDVHLSDGHANSAMYRLRNVPEDAWAETLAAEVRAFLAKVS